MTANDFIHRVEDEGFSLHGLLLCLFLVTFSYVNYFFYLMVYFIVLVLTLYLSVFTL